MLIGASDGIGHVAMAICAFAWFAASVLIWFGTGNMLAPPFAWFGAALWSASMGHGPVRPDSVNLVYGILGAACCTLAAWVVVNHFRARHQRVIDNHYLSDQTRSLATIFTAATSDATNNEMGFDHLQRLRFALDRALQPMDAFDGFDMRDQATQRRHGLRGTRADRIGDAQDTQGLSVASHEDRGLGVGRGAREPERLDGNARERLRKCDPLAPSAGQFAHPAVRRKVDDGRIPVFDEIGIEEMLLKRDLWCAQR